MYSRGYSCANGPVNIASDQLVGEMGWNTKKLITMPRSFDDGFADVRDDPNTIIPSPTGMNVITLYAQWKPVTYTVDYLGNGATSGSTASSVHTYDVAKALTANGFTRKYTLTVNAQGGRAGNKSLSCNWPFKNWNKAANGSSTSFTNKASIKNLSAAQSAHVKLYAQRTAGKVTLPNPGTKANNRFLGWYTAASGGTKAGDAGDSISISKNTTVYAHWQQRTTVEYYTDGLTMPVYTEVVDAGSTYFVKAAATTAGAKPGCAKFDGWYKDSTYTSKFVNGTVVSGDVFKLYGRNAVDLSYDTTKRSVVLSDDFEFYIDDALESKLVDVKCLYPATKQYWYGQTATFNTSRLTLYFIAYGIVRDYHPSSGVYTNADATSSSVSSLKLTKNTTVCVDWPWPVYDGVIDDRSLL